MPGTLALETTARLKVRVAFEGRSTTTPCCVAGRNASFHVILGFLAILMEYFKSKVKDNEQKLLLELEDNVPNTLSSNPFISTELWHKVYDMDPN